jgi:hypothetical protein
MYQSKSFSKPVMDIVEKSKGAFFQDEDDDKL